MPTALVGGRGCSLLGRLQGPPEVPLKGVWGRAWGPIRGSHASSPCTVRGDWGSLGKSRDSAAVGSVSVEVPADQ